MNDITISIVSHRHDGLLDDALRDLDAQPELAGTTVIVTLNIPEPDFDASAYPNLMIVTVRNAVPKGFSTNHNAAFAHCTTRWYVVLNPDIRLNGSEPFAKLVDFASDIDRLAVAAPQIVSSNGDVEDAVRANLTPISVLLRAFGKSETVEPIQPSRRGTGFYWLVGACLMFDAAAFAAVGGFDERYHLYCEDYEICARFYDKGYALAVDRSVSVIHDAQRGSHSSFRHLRWHLASLFLTWSSRSFWRVTLGL